MEMTIVAKLMMIGWMVAVGFIVFIALKALIKFIDIIREKPKTNHRKHATVVYPVGFFPSKR